MTHPPDIPYFVSNKYLKNKKQNLVTQSFIICHNCNIYVVCNLDTHSLSFSPEKKRQGRFELEDDGESEDGNPDIPDKSRYLVIIIYAPFQMAMVSIDLVRVLLYHLVTYLPKKRSQ